MVLLIKVDKFRVMNGFSLPRTLGWLLLMAGHVVLSGCLASLSTLNSVDVSPASVSQCEQPRPRVCTMEYLPVCAALSAGGSKTYASACNACADIAVATYVDGACETSDR